MAFFVLISFFRMGKPGVSPGQKPCLQVFLALFRFQISSQKKNEEGIMLIHPSRRGESSLKRSIYAWKCFVRGMS